MVDTNYAIAMTICGIFLIICVIGNFNWFFKSKLNNTIVSLLSAAFGRDVTRIIYGIVGCGLIIFGFYILF